MVTIKETPRAKTVIEAIKGHIERRQRVLSPEEQSVRKYILMHFFNNAEFPDLEGLAREFSLSAMELHTILKKLDEYDAIKLGENRVEIAYPFSLLPTNYSVYLLAEDGTQKRSFYANCAIDALGVAYMFNCDIKITAHSAITKDPVEIVIKKGVATSYIPEKILIFGGTNYCSKAASSLCGSLLFFASDDEFNEWKALNPAKQGERLDLGEALYASKTIFQNRLKDQEI